MIPRIPTHDIYSEIALVSAVLIKPAMFDMLGDMVTGQDFFSDFHGKLFDLLHDIHASGKPAGDIKVILPILRAADLPLPEGQSLAQTLAKYIGEGVPYHAKFYASKILSCSQKRKLAMVAQELANRALDDSEEANTTVEWLDAQIQGLAQSRQTPARQADEIAQEWLADIDVQMKSGKPRGVPTGLPTYDLTYGNLMPGEFTVLAAGPAIGKSSLGMQIACHNAEHKRRVLVVSLEMRDKELIARYVSKLAEVNGRDIRAGNIDADDRRKLGMGVELIRDIPLTIWSPSGATMAQIRAVAKLHAAGKGIDLLVVDYVGKITTSDPKLRKHEQISQFTAGLTALAKELSVPVLCLAQLNREGTEGEPQLSNLAESSSLERDADTVIFLHRDPKTPRETKLITAKHRHGESGFMMLGWEPVRQTFIDPQSPAREPQRRNQPERYMEFDQYNGGAK